MISVLIDNLKWGKSYKKELHILTPTHLIKKHGIIPVKYLITPLQVSRVASAFKILESKSYRHFERISSRTDFTFTQFFYFDRPRCYDYLLSFVDNSRRKLLSKSVCVNAFSVRIFSSLPICVQFLVFLLLTSTKSFKNFTSENVEKNGFKKK